MNKKVLAGAVVIIAILVISVVAIADPEGQPFKYWEKLFQKFDELINAVKNLKLQSNVTVINQVPTPNVTVNNQIPTPNVTVNNQVPVPNVTVVSNGSGIVFSLKCSWVADRYTWPSTTCNPPSCPAGYTDLGTGKVVTVTESTGFSPYHVFGYAERWCAK